MASTVMHPKAAAGPDRSERRNVVPVNSPRGGGRKLLLSQRSLRAQARSHGAPHQIRQAKRDRAAASIEGDHLNPSRKARKSHSPPSLPASEGPLPRSARLPAETPQLWSPDMSFVEAFDALPLEG